MTPPEPTIFVLWNNNARNCRSANRNNNLGFRLLSSR